MPATGVKKKPRSMASPRDAGDPDAPGLREIKERRAAQEEFAGPPPLKLGPNELHATDAGRKLAGMGPLEPHSLKTGVARKTLHSGDDSEGKKKKKAA